MKSIIAFVTFAVSGSLACADSLARQFAETIIRQNMQVPDDELDLSEWRQSVSGGYILRFAFDVDADGTMEQFFASSFNTEKLVCDWTVYVDESGKMLGKATALRPDGFWWNSTTHELLDYVRFGAAGGTAIISQMSKNGLTTRNEPVAYDELTSGLGAEEAPRLGFQRIRPEIKISLLADIVANADAVWRMLVLDEAGHNYSLPNGRLLLTDDATRVESLRKFTPKAAFAALQEAYPKSDPQSNDKPTSVSPSEKANERPKKRESATFRKSTDIIIKESTPFPWWLIASSFGIFVLALAAWLKRRKSKYTP